MDQASGFALESPLIDPVASAGLPVVYNLLNDPITTELLVNSDALFGPKLL